MYPFPFFLVFFLTLLLDFFFLKQHLQKFDYIITTQTYFVYFMNQHFPSFPYTEMLQLSFLIFVQCNIKGKRERKQTKLSVVCLGVLWPFLRQSGKKKHSVQVIFIIYIMGGKGKENKTVNEMLLIV